MLGQQGIEVKEYTNEFRAVENFLSYIEKPAEFPSLYSEAYLQWKIGRNPFGPSTCYLCYEHNMPVAHASATAKPLNPWLKLEYGCEELGDNHTHPEFRERGHLRNLARYILGYRYPSRHREGKLVYATAANPRVVAANIRLCGLELFRESKIIELERSPLQRWALPRLHLPRPVRQLRHCSDQKLLTAAIDRLWSLAGAKAPYLLKKDGAWWQWRYAQASETYLTYIFQQPSSNEVLAYIVAKFYRRRFSRTIRLCELFGATPELAAEVLVLWMQQIAQPADQVVVWGELGTPVVTAAQARDLG